MQNLKPIQEKFKIADVIITLTHNCLLSSAIFIDDHDEKLGRVASLSFDTAKCMTDVNTARVYLQYMEQITKNRN